MFTPLKQSKTYTVFFQGHMLVLTDERHHQVYCHQVSLAPLILPVTTIGVVHQTELGVPDQETTRRITGDGTTSRIPRSVAAAFTTLASTSVSHDCTQDSSPRGILLAIPLKIPVYLCTSIYFLVDVTCVSTETTE
jgi:hypothetical protein